MKYKNTIMLSLPTQQYVDMAITNKLTKIQFVIKTDEEQIHTIINKKSSEYIDECKKMIRLLKKYNRAIKIDRRLLPIVQKYCGHYLCHLPIKFLVQWLLELCT